MAPLPSLSAVLSAFLLINNATSFTLVTPLQTTSASKTFLQMSTVTDSSSRRAFLTTAAISAAAVTSSPRPAAALGGGGLKKANAKLAAYGLPGFGTLPDGFAPLVELYGQARNRDPLLVQFAYPTDWVVQLPNIDKNGEEGTIQAGQYSAGDTATLYVTPGKVNDVTSQSKDFFEDAVIKSISQKGSSVYQNFKVTKLTPLDGEYKGQKYMIVDFKYQLLTGAGFEVDRKGVASVTSVGDNTQVLWSATTAVRYKKLEGSLRTIANSFRCYSDGLTFALKTTDED